MVIPNINQRLDNRYDIKAFLLDAINLVHVCMKYEACSY